MLHVFVLGFAISDSDLTEKNKNLVAEVLVWFLLCSSSFHYFTSVHSQNEVEQK